VHFPSPTTSAPSSRRSSASPVASSAPRQRASLCTPQVRPRWHRARGGVRQVRWRRPLPGNVRRHARPQVRPRRRHLNVPRHAPPQVPSPTASAPSPQISLPSPVAASTTSSGPSSPRQRASPSRVRPSPTWSRPRAQEEAGDRRNPDMPSVAPRSPRAEERAAPVECSRAGGLLR